MKELPLHPLSVTMALRFEQPRTPEDACRFVGELFDGLAQAVDQREKAVIGHIKGLALTDAEDYLKVSIVSPKRPAQVETSLRRPVKTLNLSTSFMVYGLDPGELYPLVQGVVSLQDRAWSGLIQLSAPAPTANHHHHEHEHNH